MPSPVHHLPVLILVLCAFSSGCKPPVEEATAPPAAEPIAAPVVVDESPQWAEKLARVHVDLAKTKPPDEALALLALALETAPASEEALAAAAKLLKETVWNIPSLALDLRLPVDHVAFSSPDSLWVSVSGLANTTLRWNLETLEIESVLFPTPSETTRSLVFDPTFQFVVIERGGVTLLCDAKTLKPIRDLGILPDDFTPSTAIAFSKDGLLVAHPARVNRKDPTLIWHLRDVGSGEIIRSSAPVDAGAPRALAAHLDRDRLRLLRADGSLLDIPLSPVEEAVTTAAQEPVELVHALFSDEGDAALSLMSRGPHLPPVQHSLNFGNPSFAASRAISLIERFPWSLQPNIWNGLMREMQDRPVEVGDQEVRILSGTSPPLRATGRITAAAFSSEAAVIAEENGTITLHRQLPLPLLVSSNQEPMPPNANGLTALGKLTEALAGTRYDETSRAFIRIPPDRRIKALYTCDFDDVTKLFPGLDFTPVVGFLKSIEWRTAKPESLLPLWDRLASSDATGASWPAILELSQDLSGTAWHHSLAAAVSGGSTTDSGPSPWNARARMVSVFGSGDTEAITTAIRRSAPSGPAAAAALELALDLPHPEWIVACVKNSAGLPPLLQQLAISRVAWLQGRKADALSGWPETFPTIAETRLREDWNGWEQADYSLALEKLRLCLAEELASVVVPDPSTQEQRQAVAEKLLNPATVSAIGRPRLAAACLNAALALAPFQEETEATFRLAKRARDLGAPVEPCLRAEALALTALGDYQNAHPRWIELITEHPVDTHQPGDYAEAAYTAFENANSAQAMEILNTGIHRFPNDPHFALRAGWVALLTGNPERAYQFLQTGRHIGFPEDKLENATALLAIAAAQSGASDDAAVHYNDLLLMSPEWEFPETLETLNWPDELKATLAQLAWGDPLEEMMPEPLPEIMLDPLPGPETTNP